MQTTYQSTYGPYSYSNQPINQQRAIVINQQNNSKNTSINLKVLPPRYQIPGHPRHAVPQMNRREEENIYTPNGQAYLQQRRILNNQQLQQQQQQQQSQQNQQLNHPQRLGIRNLGNTCYLNAVLQALQADGECMRIIGNKYHDKYNATHQPSLLSYWYLSIFNCQKQNNPLIDSYIVDFKNTFNQKYSSINPHGQQDAQECLSAIIDVLHEELVINKQSVSKQNFEFKSNERILQKFSEYQNNQKQSVLYDLYGCSQLQKIFCEKCRYTLYSFLTTPILSLQMNSNDKTIQSLIKSNFKPESLKDYKCEGCKSTRSVQKEISLIKLPDVMIFHLKRYQEAGLIKKLFYSPYEKNSDGIDIDENIDLTSFLCQTQQNKQKYKLSAVIQHSGTKDSGHYTSFAQVGDNWIHFNDSQVTILNHNEYKKRLTQNSKAYILMYRKI